MRHDLFYAQNTNTPLRIPMRRGLKEVRRVREEIAKECNNDPKVLGEYLKQLESRHADRLSTRKPLPLKKI